MPYAPSYCKVKIDSSLIVKIIVSLKVKLGWERYWSSPFLLKRKLPSFGVLGRKKYEMYGTFVPECTEVYIPSVPNLQVSYLWVYLWTIWIVNVSRLSSTQFDVGTPL